MQGKRGAPIVFENVKGDSTRDGGDVRMVDLGDELHSGRSKGIVIWDDDVLQYREVRDALTSTWGKSVEPTTSK
jgi:hypothetical protein